MSEEFKNSRIREGSISSELLISTNEGVVLAEWK